MPEYLTPADLQFFITRNTIAARIHLNVGKTPTVPAAAHAMGVDPEQIIKTLVFQVARGGEAVQQIVVISNGEQRVDRGKLAAHLGVAKSRITFASTDVVLSQIGYPVGGVPPFGHRTQLSIIVDESILSLEQRYGGVIFAGGGDHQSMMELNVRELLRVTQPEIVAVGEGIIR